MLERDSQIAARPGHRSRGQVPQLYRPYGKGKLPELYLRDAKAKRLITRLKWFISTCIVATAGLGIIGIAIYASTDMEDGSGMVGSIRSATLAAFKPRETGNLIEDRFAALGEKTDKIKTTTKGLTTRYVIQDSVVERRNNREFISVKPYNRIFATLSTVKPDDDIEIPAFNPVDLYAEQKTSGSGETVETQQDKAPHNDFLSVRVVELAGGFLPEEDKQELSEEDAERIVAEADVVLAETATTAQADVFDESAPIDQGSTAADSIEEATGEDTSLAYTTILEKSPEADEQDDGLDLLSVIVESGDTLVGILKDAGAQRWQANAISEALLKTNEKFVLRPGHEIRLRMAPVAENPNEREPFRVSLFSGVKSEGTVELIDGEYKPSDDHIQVTETAGKPNARNRATLYESIYSAALAENLPPALIMDLLRTFSYDVDYKQKVRPGDGFELFFDVQQKGDGEEKPGELLYISMNVGGESLKYYRFRTPDGEVDFYNTKGSNSRKFLMRKPVKAGRFTSGFGYRRHPLLGIKKMHKGVDWAAPTGTPIMAAGNGTVEAAGRHGGNGNYVRIRHGNGYKTSYSHLHRIGKGVKKGAKVKQGEVIGYVGSTGLSTGPHLHYEVHVNNRPTNPLKIHVPRSRQLNGRMLTEFLKEAERIDELMHRTPVKTQIASANE